MKTDSKRNALFITLALNIIFFIAFVFVIGPKHETNDDLALSLLVEGAYGTHTPYMIYSNVLWGKLLTGLYTLFPLVKWYMVLMLGMLFAAFNGMTYMILRLSGSKTGLVISTTMLLFLGYASYVVFQYSRIAPVVTACGLLLLAYAIEYADGKCEKGICIITGAIMAVWGSLVRFQMFALAVVLVGGAVVILLVWRLWKYKAKNWFSQIGSYVVIYGVVGVLCIGCYVIDAIQYSSEEWQYFQKFNTLRTELWDYGFPDYEENQELFEEIGISSNDYEFYQTWNMDEEYLTVENLQVIVDAKQEKNLNLLGFLSIFPKYFFGISVFILFLVVSVVAIGMKWKNIWIVLFESIGVMVFEAYFFYIGRYGIARIDNGMWMVAALTLIYVLSREMTKFKECEVMTWKKTLFLTCIVAIIFVADFVRVPLVLDGVVNESKDFYEEIMKDDEHLYIMTADAPKLYYAFDLWETSQEGELSNVYNAYGWEFNHEVKKNVLNNYGISNVYRDAINNPKAYFVTGEESDILLRYIQENYNPNVRLIKADEVEGVVIWSLSSR